MSNVTFTTCLNVKQCLTVSSCNVLSYSDRAYYPLWCTFYHIYDRNVVLGDEQNLDVVLTTTYTQKLSHRGYTATEKM